MTSSCTGQQSVAFVGTRHPLITFQGMECPLCVALTENAGLRRLLDSPRLRPKSDGEAVEAAGV